MAADVVRTRVWRNGILEAENFPFEEISDYICQPDCVVWADLCQPTAERLASLADELSLGLAPIIVKQVFARLEEVRKAGITVLVVEQNARLAMKFADYLYVLKYGRVVMEGARQEFEHSTALVDAYLGV